MASTNTFGLTVESVRKHHFPHTPEWTERSRPSESTVTEKILEQAATLAGALNGEAIDASTITEVTSPAYLNCRQQLRRMVAIDLVEVLSGTEPTLVQSWKRASTAFFDGLEEGGATFLGGGATSTGTSEPDGPTDFISELSLEVGDADDASDVVPVLRRGDSL